MIKRSVLGSREKNLKNDRRVVMKKRTGNVLTPERSNNSPKSVSGALRRTVAKKTKEIAMSATTTKLYAEKSLMSLTLNSDTAVDNDLRQLHRSSFIRIKSGTQDDSNNDSSQISPNGDTTTSCEVGICTSGNDDEEYSDAKTNNNGDEEIPMSVFPESRTPLLSAVCTSTTIQCFSNVNLNTAKTDISFLNSHEASTGQQLRSQQTSRVNCVDCSTHSISHPPVVGTVLPQVTTSVDLNTLMNDPAVKPSLLSVNVESERGLQSNMVPLPPPGSRTTRQPTLKENFYGIEKLRRSKPEEKEKQQVTEFDATVFENKVTPPLNIPQSGFFASYSSAGADTEIFDRGQIQGEILLSTDQGSIPCPMNFTDTAQICSLRTNSTDICSEPIRSSLSTTLPLMFHSVGGTHYQQRPPRPPRPPQLPERQISISGGPLISNSVDNLAVASPNQKQLEEGSCAGTMQPHSLSLTRENSVFRTEELPLLPNDNVGHVDGCLGDSRSLELHRQPLSPAFLSADSPSGLSGSKDLSVVVNIGEARTHDQDEVACNGVEGRERGSVSDQQWLQVPILFYLVFNLIKLHETQRLERGHNTVHGFEDSSLPPFSHRPFVSLDISLKHIYTQLAHTFLEVKSVLLKPYFTRWSDTSLRNCVLEVANAWKKKGPSSQEFVDASFRLLNDVSMERGCHVKQTPLYRVWFFFGAPDHAFYITVFIVFVVLLAIVCLLFSFMSGAPFEAANIVVTVLLGIIVLVLGGINLLLLDHNAVAGEVREFCNTEMLNRVAGAIHYFSEDENYSNNTIDAEYSSYQSCGRRLVNPFEGVEVEQEDAVGMNAAESSRKGICFLKNIHGAAATVMGWGNESGHDFNAELKRDSTHHEGNDGKRFLGENRNEENQQQYFGSRGMEKFSNVDVQPYRKPTIRRNEAMLEDDRYNALLVSSVSFEQQQLAEERMKSMMVRKSLVAGIEDSLPLDLQYYSPFLDDLKGSTTFADGVQKDSFPGPNTDYLSSRTKNMSMASGNVGGNNNNNNNINHISNTVKNSNNNINNNNNMNSNTAITSRGSISVSGNTGSLNSNLSAPLLFQRLRESLVSGGLDALSITALVYCRSSVVREDVLSKLWNRNFLVLQRTALEDLDTAFHRGSERFKVFLLHVPDLDAGQLRIALSWLLQERRAVFFFSSALGSMPSEVPYPFRLELPLTTRDVEAILLSGIGIDEEMNSVCIFRPSKQFKLPPYTLGRRLGGGTFGNVFEAEMEMTGARCAVKRMYLRNDRENGTLGVIDQLKEIAHEVEIMSSLTHPNIVRYLFCGRDDNCVSIFMELCSGGSLSELITRGELRCAEEIKDILRDVIDAVVYLHGKRIVHRDLKPENVLFRDGRAKVSDFGTAVFKRGGLTNVKGTFAYMAPEVLLGETYGKACDVWSIGCIAAEALSVSLSHRNLGLPGLCEKYRRMSLDETLDFDCNEPTVRSFLELCLQRDPNKRCSAEGLLEHPMLKQEDNMAVHQWLLMCAGQRKAQQSRNCRGGDGVTLNVEHVNSQESLSATSLRSADLLGMRTTPRHTPTKFSVV